MLTAFYAPMKSPEHPTPSGDRRMAQLFVKALQQAGHQVHLASQHRAYEGKGDSDTQTAIKKEGDRQALGLLDAYADGRIPPPDVWFTYHLYHKASDWIGPRISEALKIPYIVAEASYAAKQEGGPWQQGLAASKQAIAMADVVISLNASDDEGIKPLIKSTATIETMAPFVDTRPYAQASNERVLYRAMTAEHYNLEPNLPWLLCVAMMRSGDKTKSYQVLGEALARIQSRDWRLLVVGSGDAQNAVTTALAPVEDRVRWLGEQEAENLPGIYAACDLYVWPAINEAFGMTFVEAQASGLPVVAGDTGGVSGVVKTPDCGKLVPSGDPQFFANALLELLENDLARQEMAKRAQARTWEYHGLNAAAGRLDQIITGLTK